MDVPYDNKGSSNLQVQNALKANDTSFGGHLVPRTFEGKEYYATADVAKIIGVTKQTVEYWRKREWLTADKRTHDGVYLYEIERVMQLKSVYHKDWMRGGYQPSPTTIYEPKNPPIPDYVIREIKDISPDTLAAHHVIYEARKTVAGKPTYVCPNCDNGTGRDGTGILPNSKNGVWLYHCFRCDETFDNIHLLALHYNLHPRSDFQEICRLACNEFNIYLESNYQPSVNRNNRYINDGQKSIAKTQIASSQALLDDTDKNIDKHHRHLCFQSTEELANEKKRTGFDSS